MSHMVLLDASQQVTVKRERRNEGFKSLLCSNACATVNPLSPALSEPNLHKRGCRSLKHQIMQNPSQNRRKSDCNEPSTPNAVSSYRLANVKLAKVEQGLEHVIFSGGIKFNNLAAWQ